MSETDLLTAIYKKVNKVDDEVGDLKVLIAGNYVTREEFDAYKKEEIQSRRFWAGFFIAVGGLAWAVIEGAAKFFTGK